MTSGMGNGEVRGMILVLQRMNIGKYINCKLIILVGKEYLC